MTKQEILTHLNDTVTAPYVTYSEKTDTEICFRVSGDTLYIDFEGSLSTRDWIYNIGLWLKEYNQNEIIFKAHGGIVDKWLSVEDTIIHNVKINNPSKIILRGFSQGGAMALFGNYILKRFFLTAIVGIEIKAITFAAPNVFEKYLSHKLFADCSLFQLSRDVVCGLPPGFLGYQKYGNVTVVDKNRPWWEWIFPWISEHSPASYRREIEKRM